MKEGGWKQWVILGLWIPLLSLSGCGDDPQQLFETAQFEERQNNQTHARELYEQIIQADPESEWAKQSTSRLQEMEKTSLK